MAASSGIARVAGAKVSVMVDMLGECREVSLVLKTATTLPCHGVSVEPVLYASPGKITTPHVPVDHLSPARSTVVVVSSLFWSPMK